MKKASFLAIAAVVLLGGCGSGGARPGSGGVTRTHQSTTSRARATSTGGSQSLTPEEMCQKALGTSSVLDWTESTVSQLREFQYGGPSPIRPLARAFPGVPGNTRGAWCGTAPKPQTTRWWAVTPGRSAMRAVDLQGPGEGVRHGLVPQGPVVP